MKEIRRNLEMKQKDMAVSLNVSVATLSDIETGKSRPGFDFLFNISRLHRVSLDYLLHGQGEIFSNRAATTAGGPRPFGEYTDDVDELLWYMGHSRLALSAILALAKEYLYKNETLIEKDIKITTYKKERKNE